MQKQSNRIRKLHTKGEGRIKEEGRIREECRREWERESKRKEREGLSRKTKSKYKDTYISK